METTQQTIEYMIKEAGLDKQQLIEKYQRFFPEWRKDYQVFLKVRGYQSELESSISEQDSLFLKAFTVETNI